MPERDVLRSVLVAGLGVTMVLSFILIADDDLDFGQRDAPQYDAVGLALSEGQGLTVPFGESGGPLDLQAPTSEFHFYPPGLPTALGLILWAGVTPGTATILLQAVAVGFLGWLLAGQVWRATRSTTRSWAAALVGWSAGFLVADQFLPNPLYLASVVPAVGFLSKYVEEQRWSFLALGTLFTAGAWLVRVVRGIDTCCGNGRSSGGNAVKGCCKEAGACNCCNPGPNNRLAVQ